MNPYEGCIADQACAGAMEIDRLRRELAAARAENERLREFADGMADAAGLYALETCIAAYRKQFPKQLHSQGTEK